MANVPERAEDQEAYAEVYEPEEVEEEVGPEEPVVDADAGAQAEPVAAAAGDRPDVLLDVQHLQVDEIDLEVENLRARVSLQAEVLDLLRLNVGADVALGRVHLDVKGVEAQAVLKVRLDNVADIVGHVLAVIEHNPQILENLTSSVGNALDDVGRGAGRAVGELGQGAAGAVEGVGKGAGKAVSDIGGGAGQAVEDIGSGTGEAVSDVGGSAADAVDDLGEATGSGVRDISGSAGHTVEKAGEDVAATGEDVGEAVGGAEEAVEETGEAVRESGADAADTGGEAAGDTREATGRARESARTAGSRPKRTKKPAAPKRTKKPAAPKRTKKPAADAAADRPASRDRARTRTRRETDGGSHPAGKKRGASDSARRRDREHHQ